MGKHSRVALYRRIHPLWIAASYVVGVITLGAYSLVSPTVTDLAQTDDVPPAEFEPHPPISWPKMVVDVPPPVHNVHPTGPKEPAPKKPKAPRRVVHRVVHKITKQPAKIVRLGRTSRLLAFLAAQVGDRYVWGGNGPNAWDCSGLTMAAFEHVGVDLPRTSQSQSLVGIRVSLSSLKRGDLLFWGGAGSAHHVAVYIGHGEYIAAENPSVGVVRRSLSFFPPTFARRVL